jgi:hypothetical protein
MLFSAGCGLVRLIAGRVNLQVTPGLADMFARQSLNVTQSHDLRLRRRQYTDLNGAAVTLTRGIELAGNPERDGVELRITLRTHAVTNRAEQI